MIRKGWNLGKKEELEIVDIDQRTFSFGFKQREDYLGVLRGRPWSINGWLLNLQFIEDDMVYNEVTFDRCPFLIQFQHLPPAAMDVENARRLGSKLGKVMLVEDPR